LERAKKQLSEDKLALEKLDKGFSMKQYEAKIKKYEALLGQKEQEINRLRRENGILVAQNDSLSREAELLREGISSAQKALFDSANNFTARQREMEAKNKELSDKVTQAAALRAENINVYAISSKGKESDGGVYKSKKVDKIRITFYLQENPLTNKEAKMIYLRIIDPSGSTVADMATGSGNFGITVVI
jgi:predicted RNase H-like nuclease (RuvC/YqgF family)